MLDRDDGIKKQECVKCGTLVFIDGDTCPTCGSKLVSPIDAVRMIADIEYICSKMEQKARGMYA